MTYPEVEYSPDFIIHPIFGKVPRIKLPEGFQPPKIEYKHPSPTARQEIDYYIPVSLGNDLKLGVVLREALEADREGRVASNKGDTPSHR